MKPRTAFQHRVTEASNRLKPLPEAQEKWAHRKIASHFSFRTKGHINVCSECGTKFDSDSKGKYVICPECGARLEIHDTRKRMHSEKRVFSTLETADGMLTAAQTGQTAGANVLLSIRPEALGYAKGDERNQLAGRITKSDYMGEIADHWAKTASGAELGFFELNPQRDLPEGTAVKLTVKPEDVVIVRED